MTTSDFICPHWKKFDKKHFDLLFTKASLTRKKDEKMFHYTHTPVLVEDEEGKTWSEERVLTLFDHQSPRKVVVVIQGNTGTGKSELCVYLSLELKKKGRKILHIDKNSSLMDILTTDIPNFYTKITGKQFPDKKQVDQLNEELTSSPGLVAKRASAGLILTLLKESEKTYDEDEKNDMQSRIEELMTKRLRILMEKGENPIDMVFVAKEDFKVGAFSKISELVPADDLEAVAKEINRILWEKIRLDYSVSTLDKALEEIARISKGLRPIIVFEDFSIAGLDLDRLARYMESDSPDFICDFIIAGLQDKVPPRSGTRVERFEYFTTTTSEQKEVLFLNEKTCVDFIAPFLCYPKDTDGGPKLRSRKTYDAVCDSCRKCSLEQRIFTPFTEVFLRNFYSSLKPEQRTPRLYVSKIGLILSDHLRDGRPPSDSSVLSELTPPVSVDQEATSDPVIQRFAAWYGTLVDRNIEVAEDTAKLLGIPAEDFRKNGKLSFPLFDPHSPKIFGDSKLFPSEEDGNRDKLNRILGQFNAWRRDPTTDPVSEFRFYFNLGLKKLFSDVTSGYRLAPRSSLGITVGQNEYPFYISGLSGTIPQSVEIQPDLFSQKGAAMLATLGYLIQKKQSHKDKHEFSRLLERALQDNAHAIGKMVYGFRRKVKAVAEDKVWAKGYYNRDLGEIVLACVRILMAFENPFGDTRPEQITQWLSSDNTHIDFEYKNNIEKSAGRRIEEILDSVMDIRRLAVDLFGLTSKSFDLEKIAMDSHTNPITIAKGINVNCGHRRLAVGPNSVLDVVKPYHQMPKIIRAIGELVFSENSPEYVNEVLAYSDTLYLYVKDLQPRNLVQHIRRLENFESAKSSFIVRLKGISQLSKTEVGRYEDRISYVLKSIEKTQKEPRAQAGYEWQQFRFFLSTLKLASDPVITSLINLTEHLERERVMLEKKPLENLFSILRRLCS